MAALELALQVLAVAMLAYFLAYNAVHTALLVVGWRAVDAYVRRRPLRDYDTIARSPLSLPVSILVPAHDEGPCIAGAVRALLAQRYAAFEVLVVDDGSSDDTLERLRAAFDLVEAERVPRAGLETAAVRSVLRSRSDERVVVVSKDNGGKADALNAGLNHARYPLVCAIDADTLLDPGALARLVWEFQADPSTVAVGGIVRILNGSRVRGGRLEEVRTPRSLLVNLQILEYLRAFLGGRIAWSRLGMLLIVSGAFGLFRRDALVEAGGYDAACVGEDAELVLRLHRTAREAGRPCRVTFFPDPICWTEAPSKLRTLVRQRDRWQRGLLQMLGRHRGMVGRKRYGGVGVVALPYFVLFEVIGPTLEVLGLPLLIAAIALGVVDVTFVALFLAAALVYGLVLSFGTLLLEERAFRRYPGWRCLGRLAVVAVVENVGWRQLMAFVRARAWWTLWRGSHAWGAQPRAGLTGESG